MASPRETAITLPIGSRVWTFLIRGGIEFSLTFPGLPQPALYHDGSFTLWKMVGTEEEVALVQSAILAQEASVRRFTEDEDGADATLRHSQAALPRQPQFRTVRCPECYFYEPTLDTQCGLESWPEETVQSALSTEKAKSDACSCPISE